MLVLTRKQDQMIEIDPHITIKVLRIRGQSVRIGIEAPEEISIHRSELLVYPADDDAECLEQKHRCNLLGIGNRTSK